MLCLCRHCLFLDSASCMRATPCFLCTGSMEINKRPQPNWLCTRRLAGTLENISCQLVRRKRLRKFRKLLIDAPFRRLPADRNLCNLFASKKTDANIPVSLPAITRSFRVNALTRKPSFSPLHNSPEQDGRFLAALMSSWHRAHLLERALRSLQGDEQNRRIPCGRSLWVCVCPCERCSRPPSIKHLALAQTWY